MIFTLEAIQAKHGDSLLLHYGSPASPQLLVIDGGPAGVYNGSLKKRLDELKASRTPQRRLPIRLLMVSHIDDDHINGVLALTRAMEDLQRRGQDRPYEIDTLWHNSFDDILGNPGEADVLAATLAPAAKAAAANNPIPASLPIQFHSALVLASVRQGRDLRGSAERLGLNVNQGDGLDGKLVTAAASGKRTIKIDGKLSFTIIGPREDRVRALQEEWDKQIKKMGVARAASFTDESVFNLSSIVVLARVGQHQMLLTGDARGDDILSGLKAAKLLKNDQIHVDLLKLPHHGSDHNVSTEFFRQVTADHYVVSGDGRHGNPEVSTLKMLSEARGKSQFTIYLTNKEPRLVKFFKEEKSRGAKYRVVFRDNQRLSVMTDLGNDTVSD